MRIGIDIDGVLTNIEQYLLDYMTKYCVENNIDFKIGSSNYHYYKTFNITTEQEKNFWNKYLEKYAIEEKARPFASEVIKKLKEEGHEIYIVTARWLTNRDDEVGENMRKIVKDWLEENDIIYDKLVFSKAEKERKSQEMLEHKIDLMIEDSPSNIKELSNIIPILCYSTGYNRECVGNRITRCYSWYDIYRKIKNM